MNTIEAAGLFGVNPNLVDGFSLQDPFNNDQVVEGYLCHHSSALYGALLIYKVNGEETKPQKIFCTPKLHYPFGRVEGPERNYHFPVSEKVDVYEKLDGTNICSYSYENAQGERFVAHKTRLSPFLKKSKFGDFFSLWEELLARYPQLRRPERVRSGEYSFSYELFGFRNPLLVSYDIALETKLLFGVKQYDATVTLPETFDDLGVNLNTVFSACLTDKELIRVYEQFREDAQAKATKVFSGSDETTFNIRGIEGYVFYLTEPGGHISQWKNKPQIVENEHWASDTLPMSVILPTVWNSIEGLEDLKDLTVAYVSALLLEEFSQLQINNSTNRIEKAINSVVSRLTFRRSIMDIYQNCGVKFDGGNKGDVMRALSPHFNRNDMKNVYTALREMNIL
jgi:hypothetical protein